MSEFLKSPVTRYLFGVSTIYFAAVLTFGPAPVISIFDTLTISFGAVFCAVCARAVWETLRDESPERASLWATGAALVLGATVVIRAWWIVWTLLGNPPWLAEQAWFGYVTALQWAGAVLAIAAVVGPENGAIFAGTRRVMTVALVAAFFLAVILLTAKYGFSLD